MRVGELELNRDSLIRSFVVHALPFLSVSAATHFIEMKFLALPIGVRLLSLLLPLDQCGCVVCACLSPIEGTHSLEWRSKSDL